MWYYPGIQVCNHFSSNFIVFYRSIDVGLWHIRNERQKNGLLLQTGYEPLTPVPMNEIFIL